jgi:hypothetical protein
MFTNQFDKEKMNNGCIMLGMWPAGIKNPVLSVINIKFGRLNDKYRVLYYSVSIDFCPYGGVKHFSVYPEMEWELCEFSYR